MRLEGNALLAGVLATSCSGFLLYGYDQGVYSGIITEPMYVCAQPDADDLRARALTSQFSRRVPGAQKAADAGIRRGHL